MSESPTNLLSLDAILTAFGLDPLAEMAEFRPCATYSPPPLDWLVVPGIRRPDEPSDDHVMPVTPRRAMEAGATWIVVGSPITRSVNPAKAAAEIAMDIQTETVT